MSKIADLLNELENSSLTGNQFIKTKIDIQDALWKLKDSTPEDSEAHLLLSKMHRTWRLLGGVDGTFLGYISAIRDLKTTLQELDTLGVDA